MTRQFKLKYSSEKIDQIPSDGELLAYLNYKLETRLGYISTSKITKACSVHKSHDMKENIAIRKNSLFRKSATPAINCTRI